MFLSRQANFERKYKVSWIQLIQQSSGLSLFLFVVYIGLINLFNARSVKLTGTKFYAKGYVWSFRMNMRIRLFSIDFKKCTKTT